MTFRDNYQVFSDIHEQAEAKNLQSQGCCLTDILSLLWTVILTSLFPPAFPMACGVEKKKNKGFLLWIVATGTVIVIGWEHNYGGGGRRDGGICSFHSCALVGVCLGFVITALQYQVVISAVFCLFCDLISFMFYLYIFICQTPVLSLWSPFLLLLIHSSVY